MITSTIVTVPPATEPISVADAKAQLRVDGAGDDALIQTMIVAARMRVESAAYQRLVTQTLQLTLDAFPWGWSAGGLYSGLNWYYGVQNPWPVIELEPPVQSVTSVAYLDPSGTPQTLSSALYRVDVNSQPARLTPALNQVWPATARETAAVTVTYVCGFGTAAQVPGNLLEAVKLLTGHYYLNREQVLSGTRLVALEIPEGFDDLVRDYAPPLVG